MLNIQRYVRAQSLEEAYTLNQNKKNKILGGMLWLKMSDETVNTAIDLCELGLDAVEETDEEFRIGAMVSLRALEQHAGLNRYSCGTVAKAVESIVGVQFRNMATVGGSLWGRFGFSDVLTFFLAMDSYVELYKGGVMPLEQFAAMPYDRDLLVRLIVKKTPGRFVYNSVRIQRTDFPVLTCAASRVNGEYKAVLGARPGKALVVRDTAGVLANGITAETVTAFSEHAAGSVPTGSNARGSAEYRSHLVRVLTERGLTELGGMQ